MNIARHLKPPSSTLIVFFPKRLSWDAKALTLCQFELPFVLPAIVPYVWIPENNFGEEVLLTHNGCPHQRCNTAWGGDSIYIRSGIQ